MKIGIDISQIIYETGVSTYTRELVRNLLMIDKTNQYILFGGSLRRMNELYRFTDSLSGNFTTRFIPLSPTAADYLWNRFHIGNIENFIGKIDVFHSSDWSQPPTKSFCVTTIHDLSPLVLPEQTPTKIVNTHKRRLRWVKREVDRIIVPSESTRKDLERMGVSKNKVVAIPEAHSDIYKPQSKHAIDELKKKYGIKGSYFLSVGNAPRKNIARTIEAFLATRDKTNVENLVVVGRGNDSYQHSDNIIFTGHVPEEDLPVFYSGAEGLLYASLYEGFGLPILESFACKTPVLISEASSLPEIAGDAAIKVNPKSLESIEKGIVKLVNNSDALIKKGSMRLKEYSWKRTAQETLKVYEQAVIN